MEQQEIATAAPARKKLIAYNIIEREGLEKAIWSRVGTAFVNRDGSLNIHLDALPVHGKLHVREERERTEWAPRNPKTTPGAAAGAEA
jgi:hypothetical protein